MAHFIDRTHQSDDGQGLDASQLSCPKCGCGGVRIVALPRNDGPAKGWYARAGKGGGKGQCDLCEIRFPIYIEVLPPEERDDAPLGHVPSGWEDSGRG